MQRKTASLMLVLLFPLLLTSQNTSSSVFSTHRWQDKPWLAFGKNHTALYGIISNEAYRLLNIREEKISRLHTADDWLIYREKLKTELRSSINRFEKTPLNSRVTGTIDRENFTVEKILFESQPGFYVTACLFIPKKRQQPAPAVIYCAGHTELGFRAETYQRVILNLVDKGSVVLAFDPIGQGERLQYYSTENGKSKIGGPTTEHSYAGAQTLLTGTSLTDYFVWDAMRAVDYLETRQEVDMERLAVTGRSGGGLQAALLAAFDDRIYATAPEAYITSFRRLLQSIGPQDAEQNPWQFIRKGFDHADFMHLHAPKPALIITTTHDFFSIQGARETYAELKGAYSALGSPENISITEDMGIHESTKNNREALYRFLIKHLATDAEPYETEVQIFSPEELQVTPNGQVALMPGSETVFSLQKKYAEKKTDIGEIDVNVGNADIHRQFVTEVFTGKYQHNQINVEKYFLETKTADFALPLYIVRGKSAESRKLLVWFHPDGKSSILDDGLLPEFLEQGFTVIAADLPGTGELNDPDFRGDGFVKGVPFNLTFGAMLSGMSIPGIQAGAVDLVSQFILARFGDYQVNTLVEDVLNTAFLLGCHNPHPYAKVVFRAPLMSNMDLVNQEYFDPAKAYHVIPGSLPGADFKELLDVLPENSFHIVHHTRKQSGIAENNYREILEFLK
jgi:cephalosporin-C deacetylase-like acetyl esterase